MFTKNEKQQKNKSIHKTQTKQKQNKTKQNRNITLKLCRIKLSNTEKII